MYQYKIYNISESDTPAKFHAVGVSGSILFTGTEPQVKKWIDREYELSQDKVESAGLRAWYIGADEWNIGDLSTVGRVKLASTRKLSEDISGVKEFRVSTRTEAIVTLRLGYSVDVQIEDTFVEYTGPKTTLKRLMKCIAEKSLFYHVRSQLEIKARKAGISEWRIIECYDNDQVKHSLNLYHLTQEA